MSDDEPYRELDPFDAGMITERLPRLDSDELSAFDWEDGIEPELELPLGELPSIIVDLDEAA